MSHGYIFVIKNELHTQDAKSPLRQRFMLLKGLVFFVK